MVYCICNRLVNINVGSGGKDIHDVFGTSWAGISCVGKLVGDDGELFAEVSCGCNGVGEGVGSGRGNTSRKGNKKIKNKEEE